MGYVVGSGVPYGKYLQAQALVDDLKAAQAKGLQRVSAEVRTGTREIVVSQEALREQNVRLPQATTDGFDRLSWDIEQVRGAIEELDATFVWGFNAVLSHTGRMADALEALLAAVKTPTKTRAYEYFDDARTAFGRGHLKDSLDLVDKAISGDHTSSGYRLEWRFHLLKGSVLVGTFAHPELLDLNGAEQSYRTAAEYAATDDRNGAALALLGASWACYCRGQLSEALELCNRSLEFCPSFGEALFQTAKILMAMNRLEGLTQLAAAAEQDPQYVLKAAGDGDFQAHSDRFDTWARAHRESKERELRTLYSSLSERSGFWLRCVEQQVDLRQVASTLTRGDPALVDLLYALRTLRQVSPKEVSSSSLRASDGVKVLLAIPAQLQIPPTLLAELVTTSRSWTPQGDFFDCARALRERGEVAALRGLLLQRAGSADGPLELFAAAADAFPTDTSVRAALEKALRGKAADARTGLIKEYESLKRSSRYAVEAVELVRLALASQYERWRPAVEESLRQSAFAGTEAPSKGAVGRFFGSVFGFMIPVVIVEKVAGTGLAMMLWIIAIALVVGSGVMKRSGIRDERLRKVMEEEEKLRVRIEPT